jgi:hypothetical protein
MIKIQAFFSLILLTFSMVFGTHAQVDSSVSVANRTSAALKIDEAYGLLSEGQVRAALVKFNEAIDKNPFSSKAHTGAAECQYKMLNYGYALKAALKAFELDKQNADAAFLIASSYHRIQELDEALKYYEIALRLYREKDRKDLNINFLIQCVHYAKKLINESVKFERKPMSGANSEFFDYSPLLLENGKRLLFVSRRSNTTGGGRNPADQMYFEDIYEAVWNPNKKDWDSVSNQLGRLNSPGFDAVSHISSDGQRLYMTINNTMDPKVRPKDRTGSSDIAMAKMSKNGSWSKPKPLPGSVNTDFFEGSPTLTKDESTMYFVGQRRTSDGDGTEILVSRLVGKAWSKATVLPHPINNKGRQTTPFISPDGKYLFFSSDSHLGMGGFDIFVSKWNGSRWSEPINLGYGINSVNDDTHFKYYPELKIAVLASVVVEGNKATYNLFTVDMSNFDLESIQFNWD